MTAKVEKWPVADVAELMEVYQPEADQEIRDAQVKQLAETLGRTVPAVRAKLVALQLYVPKAKTAGKAGMAKGELVKALAGELGVDEGLIETLEKATKVALRTVLKRVRELKAE